VQGELVIAEADPAAPDVAALLDTHLAFARDHTPPEDVFALDSTGRAKPDLTFFAAREAGVLRAVGALRQLDVTAAEIKSMHTAVEARRRGVARAILDRLIDVAQERGYTRVSLETGSMEAFAPARALYEAAGFVECRPFADYPPIWSSTFMTLELRP